MTKSFFFLFDYLSKELYNFSMIGIDIIKTQRIAQSIQSERFLTSVFTQKEREYYEKKNHSIDSLAGFFAAKEAVAKALGTGFTQFKFSDIEIDHNQQGKPFVVFYNNAKALADGKIVELSISHCSEFAIAMAMVFDNVENKSVSETENSVLDEKNLLNSFLDISVKSDNEPKDNKDNNDYSNANEKNEINREDVKYKGEKERQFEHSEELCGQEVIDDFMKYCSRFFEASSKEENNPNTKINEDVVDNINTKDKYNKLKKI